MVDDRLLDVSQAEPDRSSGELLPESAVCVETVNLCGRRLLQVERLKGYLLANGHRTVTRPEAAEYVLLVGCAFNDHTERVSTEAFERHRLALRPDQRLFVLEGLADMRGPSFVRDGLCAASEVIPTTSFGRLDRFFARRVCFDDTPEANLPGQFDGRVPAMASLHVPMPAPHDRAVFSIQVATGCLDHCTYCGDKPIVGPLRSRGPDRVLAQVRQAAELGYRAIELIGDDVGSYGLDIGTDLPALLNRVADERRIERLSLLEINVKYLVRYETFLDRFLPRALLRKMAVAFQSGNDRVLALMDRGYDAADVGRIARRLSAAGVWKHAHVIVGFPSETDAEFRESCALLLDGGFESATLFLYQDRPGTPSSVMYPKVSEAVKQHRLDEARARLSEAGFSVSARQDKLQVCRVPAPL